MNGEIAPSERFPEQSAAEQQAPLENLVKAAQAGDMEAMGDIYAQTHSVVYGYMYHRTGDPEQAADLTQRIYERAIHKIGNYEERGSFRGWLLTIGHNLFLDTVRREKRHVVGIPESVVDLIVAPENVESEALATVDTSLEDVLACVSETYRDAVRLVIIGGLSYQEAADRLGIPLGTLRSRNHRGIAELKKRFKNRDELLFPEMRSA